MKYIFYSIILIFTTLCVYGNPEMESTFTPFKFADYDDSNKKFIAFQDTLTWKILNELEYKEAKHDTYGSVYLPEFSNDILKFANKKVIIKGYIIPVDKTTYALSKNVYAACFFCGKSGPETVMGLSFKKDPGKLKMDSNALLTGYFRLNGTNVDDWMYQLEEVEIINIK
ncbi:MAG: hypothetical protein IPM42_19745 [Saprospiraceae bacterium]|nr:hypothetical protein [Saprospiraceae bacterium]